MVKGKRKIKKTFAIHHWCGLLAGVFLLLISLTGAILVFDDDIDSTLFAKHKRLAVPATHLTFDASFEKIRAAYPGWEIRIPELPATLHENILYELRQGKLRKWLFVHPATGEVQSQVERADLRFTYILLNIHYNLFSGTPGKVVVLLVGIAFLISLVTGIILYRKSIGKVLLFRQKISFRTPRIMFSSLHRVLGVWGLLFNLLMCLSGLFLSYLVVNNAIKPKNKSIAVPALTYSVDEAMAKARAAYPDFTITYLRFPVNAEGSLQLLGRLQEDPLYYGKYYSGLSVGEKGEIAKALFLRDSPWYVRMFRVLQPLHFGDYAGLWVKIIYSVGAILPALLSITGFLLWRSRSQVKPTVRRNVRLQEAIS